MKHLQINVYGRVQGVFFRQNTCDEAKRLGLKGTVANKPDGSVEIHAEGSEEYLGRFVQWCQQGPDSAVVEKVEVADRELENFEEFRIS